MILTTSSNRVELLQTILVYLLCAIAFCIPLLPWVGTGLIGVAALVAAYKMIVTKKWEIRRGPGWGLLLGFVGCSALSITQSPIPAFSAGNWAYGVGCYMIVYFLTLTYIDTPQRRMMLLWSILGAAFLACVYGLIQFSQLYGVETQDWVDPDTFPLLKRRMFSTLQNPNLMGAYLLEILALSGTWALWGRKCKPEGIPAVWLQNRWMPWALSFFFLLCLVLTYSRGIWVSMACLVLFWGLVLERRLLFTLLVIPAIMFFYHGGIATRLWSLFGHQDTSVSLRYALWDSTTYMIAEHPWLGIGWGSYWQVYPSYNYFIQDPNTIIYHAHNMYLHLMAVIGIPGALCFFLFILYIVIRCLRLPRTGDFWQGMARYGAPAMVLGICISGMTDYELFSHQVAVVFWQVLALAAGLVMASKRDSLP